MDTADTDERNGTAGEEKEFRQLPCRQREQRLPRETALLGLVG
jgi:hypothetical protein